MSRDERCLDNPMASKDTGPLEQYIEGRRVTVEW